MPSSERNTTLITAVTLAVAALGAWGALNSYLVSAAYSQQYPDAYGGDRAQVRFTPLTARIPASAELGYITDLDPSQPAYAPAFLSAQYAVAPRGLATVNAQTRPEFAVGNFSRPSDFAALGEAHGYAMVQDFGNGVILFHRL